MGKLTLGLEDKHCRRASGAVAIEVSSSGPFRGKQPLAKGTAAGRQKTEDRHNRSAKPFVATGCSPQTASRLGRNSMLDRVSEANQTRAKRKCAELDFDEAQAENLGHDAANQSFAEHGKCIVILRMQ